MKKPFINNIDEINANILEAENLLKEAMNFCEDDSMDEYDMEDEPVDDEYESDVEPEMDSELDMEETENVDSYIDNIRKYALNGLSALCDNPESEEYQMLKKIFQMCDKKPEKKESMSESHRLFGVLKENKNIVFEASINNTDDFNTLRNTLVTEAISKGYNPSEIRLVSENKIIK